MQPPSDHFDDLARDTESPFDEQAVYRRATFQRPPSLSIGNKLEAADSRFKRSQK